MRSAIGMSRYGRCQDSSLALREKEPSKAFGFPLPDPLRILKAGFFAALGLGCFKLVLHRLFHQLESAVISVLEPVLLGIHELGPGLVSQPLALHLVECYVEPLDGAWCFGGLVLDEVEPGLDLFPVGCFPFLPDPSCFCWDQWLVLGSKVGCSSLGCPWVLLEQVLLCDGNPVSQSLGLLHLVGFHRAPDPPPG